MASSLSRCCRVLQRQGARWQNKWSRGGGPPLMVPERCLRRTQTMMAGFRAAPRHEGCRELSSRSNSSNSGGGGGGGGMNRRMRRQRAGGVSGGGFTAAEVAAAQAQQASKDGEMGKKPAAAAAPSKLSGLLKTHGKPFLVLWTTVWVAGIPTLYSVVSANPTAVIDGLKFIGANNLIDVDTYVNPGMGNMAVSVALNELLEPLRLPLCVALTPAFKEKVKHIAFFQTGEDELKAEEDGGGGKEGKEKDGNIK